jgi:hypothetical protein
MYTQNYDIIDEKSRGWGFKKEPSPRARDGVCESAEETNEQ